MKLNKAEKQRTYICDFRRVYLRIFDKNDIPKKKKKVQKKEIIEG